MRSAIIQYLKECYEELRKVVWPSKKDVKNHTILVIILSLVFAVFFGLLDYIFSIGLGNLIIR